jgi:hypothetical protein
MARWVDADNGWVTVVAIDPGGTTGWSVMCVEADALCDPDVSILKSIAHRASGQVDLGNEDAHAGELVELLAAWPLAAVVIEDFQLRTFKMSRELLSPVRITAKVEYALFHGLQDCVPEGRRVFKQNPSLAKSTATDDRLKQWRLYIREGGMEHARDADRHAITFLRRAKDKPKIRHAAWPHLFDEDGSMLEWEHEDDDED